MHHFKRRSHVIVEAAHQAGAHFIGNPCDLQIPLNGFEMRAAIVTQMIDNGRQLLDNRLVLRHFAVEHAQRVGLARRWQSPHIAAATPASSSPEQLDVLRAAAWSPTELISS